jgi:hypothetical protein
MAQKRGDLLKAKDYIERTKKIQKYRAPVNQCLMMGKILHQLGDYPGAKKEFHTVMEIAKTEGYASIGLANISYDIST